MFHPSEERYASMKYNRCGRSGIKLPGISLGLWHNFGEIDRLENMRELVKAAFERGITHYDLANNYGPPPGSAEENFGRIFKSDLSAYRDELIISTKAGYYMWPGPYGEWGSKKNLVASLDQSLKRMGLEYVDIFYHHRPDPETPIEETMEALDLVVRQGKALYVGISNYNAEESEKAISVLKQLGRPLLIHQVQYSMLNRRLENGLQELLKREGSGVIAFCPLEQGMLTDRYLEGIPADSRAQKSFAFLKKKDITPEKLDRIRRLQIIALQRGQTLAQMALSWVLRNNRVTSALIGASKVSQIEDNIAALSHTDFTEADLSAIDGALAGRG